LLVSGSVTSGRKKTAPLTSGPDVPAREKGEEGAADSRLRAGPARDAAHGQEKKSAGEEKRSDKNRIWQFAPDFGFPPLNFGPALSFAQCLIK
jgi:hypothetical protein